MLWQRASMNAFANSSHPITAATDRAFHTSFFKQFGDLFFMIKAITLISFLSLVLVVGSTLTLSIRQRTKDIGILKSVGFSHARILSLVLMESFFIVCAGSFIGLALAAITNVLFGLLLPQFLPSMSLPMNIPIETFFIVLGLSVVTSLVPGLLALRMRPVERWVTNSDAISHPTISSDAYCVRKCAQAAMGVHDRGIVRCTCCAGADWFSRP